MALAITLPEQLEAELQQQANIQRRSIEEIALGILRDALESDAAAPSGDDIVARIRATAPDHHNPRPARGSLADVLRGASTDTDFDLAHWPSEWAAVEDQLRATTRADDRAEGGG